MTEKQKTMHSNAMPSRYTVTTHRNQMSYYGFQICLIVNSTSVFMLGFSELIELYQLP